MAVDVDYYDVLGIARDADAGAIDAASRKLMREWRKKTAAADLGVRQGAELKVKHIEEARKTLLDAAKRAQYDQALAGGVKKAPSAQVDSGDGQTWLERAEGFLAVGDYHSAAYAAREATHVEAVNAKTWWIRSRANAGLGQWQDALYEARQATTLEENNADYHFNLGLIHEQMDAFGDAIGEYQRAGACDPGNPIYELAIGGVYASNGRPDQALPIIEAVYSKHPQDANANYYLGSVLIDLAEQVPASRTRDGYIVKSKAEIDRMRELVNRAMQLNLVDGETKQSADHIVAYLDEMEQKKFRPPWAFIDGTTDLFDGGCIAVLLGIGIIIGVIFLPLILISVGFGQMSQNPGVGLTFLLIGAGLCWVWWNHMYIPRWKHNKRDL